MLLWIKAILQLLNTDLRLKTGGGTMIISFSISLKPRALYIFPAVTDGVKIVIIVFFNMRACAGNHVK